MDNQPITPKQQVVERLKGGQSVIVTVGQNPTVDEIASAIGLNYILDKFGKKVTTVISSPIPGVLKFLKPENVTHKTMDRLRDFVIEINKDKADKLRYKAEEEVVKVFITPYKAPISEKDLRFSQGDYNVDTIVVIGANSRDQLDKVMLENTRLLDEASAVTISNGAKDSGFGAVNWHEPQASSPAEMLVSLVDALQGGLLDKNSAEALLSAIVSATDGFRNKATTPKVMTIAAQLMANGADQQTVMENLGVNQPKSDESKEKRAASDTLAISHQEPKKTGKNQEHGPKQHYTKAPEKSEHALLTITPEAKPEPAKEIAAEPKETPKPAQHSADRFGTAGDSQLASDAIDALINTSRQTQAEIDKAEANVKTAAQPPVPIMSHHAEPVSHINTHPVPPVLKSPDAGPAAESPVPKPTVETKPADTAVAQPSPDTSHLDEARQAVVQAYTAHPEIPAKPISPLAPEIIVDQHGQIQNK